MLKNAFSLFLVIISSMMLGSYFTNNTYGIDTNPIVWLITYVLLILNGFVLVVGLINYGKKSNNDSN